MIIHSSKKVPSRISYLFKSSIALQFATHIIDEHGHKTYFDYTFTLRPF